MYELINIGIRVSVTSKDNLGNAVVEDKFRVAKCHRYGRYICVKILEGWGKKCRRPRSFVK